MNSTLLFTYFLAGVLAALAPCVLPIPPVTVNSERLCELANFGGQHTKHEITLEFQDPDIGAYAWTFG